MVQHVRLRVRILVKAFPQQSKKHEETVCCAGITEDGQQMLRLFPIRFRRLPKAQQFERFDLIEVLATKAGDPRPESYRVDEASIQLIEKANTLSEETKVRLWQPFIAPSLKALHEERTCVRYSFSQRTACLPSGTVRGRPPFAWRTCSVCVAKFPFWSRSEVHATLIDFTFDDFSDPNWIHKAEAMHEEWPARYCWFKLRRHNGRRRLPKTANACGGVLARLLGPNFKDGILNYDEFAAFDHKTALVAARSAGLGNARPTLFAQL